MIDYRTPLSDILFALDHAAEAGRLPGWDRDLAAEVLGHAARLVDEVIAPIDPLGDAEGCRLEGGEVRMPAAFRAAWEAYAAGGWPALSAPEEFGGQGLPHILSACLSEMLAGASLSFQMVLILGTAALRTLAANASADQKARLIPRLASGEWLATMALTEPQAGSDLSLVRTTASPEADGSWRITGSKIFISGGGHDLTGGRILHLVLARTGDPSLGTKALSLFACPSILDDGGRNAISVLRLEEKMGMHASPTCQLAFDGAWSEIIGRPGEGLARMFTMMNIQRLEVALEGIGLAEAAGQRSRAYAATRRQGRLPGRQGPQPIAAHDDVRRMLLAQIALTQGCRAMIYRGLVELELDPASPLVQFMTPVCKAFATEAAMAAADHAIQVHGGYGFLREYRVEQLLRDGRITKIYEGTNGIQAATLAGRLLSQDGGRPAEAFGRDAEAAAALAGRVAPALATALGHWRSATEAVRGSAALSTVADAYMRLSGLVALGAAWARLESAGAKAPNPTRIAAAAEYVARWMLPESAHLAALCAGASPLSGLDDEVFA